MYRPLARKLLAGFREPWQTVRLILDTTKVGAGHRILTVSFAYAQKFLRCKRALPLAWSVHSGRKGHTGAEKQIALLERLKPLLPEESEVHVVGDSEFSSVKMLRWLSEEGFAYVLRTGGHCKVYHRGKETSGWRKLGQIPLEEGQTRFVGAVRFTEEHDYEGVHLLMHWAEGEEEPWYLLSSAPVSAETIKRYEKRMWTEEMYADLKGHGVDLEATGLVHSDRAGPFRTDRPADAGSVLDVRVAFSARKLRRKARVAALGGSKKPARQELLPHRVGLHAAMYSPCSPHQATF